VVEAILIPHVGAVLFSYASQDRIGFVGRETCDAPLFVDQARDLILKIAFRGSPVLPGI
jgi:hypothetical protein